VRGNLIELWEILQGYNDKAVACVQHNYRPQETIKMDGRTQSDYARKNWSSVMAFNVAHPANQRLTVEDINTRPGRDLHRFYWLQDDEIGALPPAWNWLAQVNDPMEEPKLVHWTLGGPWLPAFEGAPFAEEWFAYRDEWARRHGKSDSAVRSNPRPDRAASMSWLTGAE